MRNLCVILEYESTKKVVDHSGNFCWHYCIYIGVFGFMKSVMSSDTIDFVKNLQFGFVASVRPDGRPSLSHKGMLTVFDENHLIFADIASTETVQNLKQNPEVTVEVMDLLSRKGHRFYGRAQIIPAYAESDKYFSFYENRGLEDVHGIVKNFVLIEVELNEAVTSPIQTRGTVTEGPPKPRCLPERRRESLQHGKMHYNNLWKF